MQGTNKYKFTYKDMFNVDHKDFAVVIGYENLDRLSALFPILFKMFKYLQNFDAKCYDCHVFQLCQPGHTILKASVRSRG